jgi:small subunit ribosomal protein S6
MRLYDIVVLVSPDLTDEDALKTLGDYRKILADGGAEFVKDESWGRRRLAFPIGRKRDAFYHHFQVKAEPALVSETERRLKLSDQIVRHLAVRADEELKRSAKMAVRIAKKHARRPPRPPAAPTAEAAAARPAAAEMPGEMPERSDS